MNLSGLLNPDINFWETGWRNNLNGTMCVQPKASLRKSVQAKPLGLFKRGTAGKRKSWRVGYLRTKEDFKPDHLTDKTKHGCPEVDRAMIKPEWSYRKEGGGYFCRKGGLGWVRWGLVDWLPKLCPSTGVVATMVATCNDSISCIFLLCGFLYLCIIL